MPFTMAIKNPAMALMMPSQQEAIAETMDPMIIIFKLKIWMGCENVAGVVSVDDILKKLGIRSG